MSATVGLRHLRVNFAKSTKVRLDLLKRNDAHACIRSSVQHTSHPDPQISPVRGTRGLLAGTGERRFDRFKDLIASRFVHRLQLVKHVSSLFKKYQIE